MPLDIKSLQRISLFLDDNKTLIELFQSLYEFQLKTISNIKFDTGDGNIIGFKCPGECFRWYVLKQSGNYYFKTKIGSVQLFSKYNLKTLQQEIQKNDLEFKKYPEKYRLASIAKPQAENNLMHKTVNNIKVERLHDVSEELVTDSNLIDIEVDAVDEEKKIATDSYAWLLTEICSKEDNVPYPDVGPYDVAHDYDEIADLQAKKRMNQRIWDDINALRKYYNQDRLYCGHLREKGDFLFTDAPLPTKTFDLQMGSVTLISTDSANYNDLFKLWKYPNKNSNIVFSRNIEMQNKNVNNVEILFDSSNELYSNISDIFLRNALKRNKDSGKIQSIIQTIQEKQNNIRIADKEESFVVQGCAGSGKTMVLLHRIRYLLYNKYISSLAYYYLVPNRTLKNFVKNTANEFLVREENIYSYTDYYRLLLSKYDKTAEEDRSETVFSADFLDLVYSEEFIKECYIDFVSYLDSSINALIDSCDSKLTELLEKERQEIIDKSNQQLLSIYNEYQETVSAFLPMINKAFDNSIEDMNAILLSLQKILTDAKFKYENEQKKFASYSLPQEILDQAVAENVILKQLTYEIKLEEDRIKKASIFTFLSHKHKLQALEERYSLSLEKLKEDIIAVEKAKYLDSLLASSKIYKEFTIDDLEKTIQTGYNLVESADRLINNIENIKNNLESNFSENLNKEINALQSAIEYSAHLKDLFDPKIKELTSCSEILGEYIQKMSELISLFEKHYLSQKEKNRFRETNKIFISKTFAQTQEYLYRNILNLSKKIIKEKHEYILCNQYKHYWFLSLYFNYLIRGNIKNIRNFLFVDEAQDLSQAELNLLYKLNNNPIINLFGDINQSISSHNIKNWNALSFIDTKFILDENFRNTNEVVEYCNSKLPYSMKPVGVNMDPVTIFEGIEQIFSTDNHFVFIVKDEYGVDDLELLIKNTTITDYEIYTIKNVKGLEFKEVFVFDRDMTDNEKYIAYTRALVKLNVISNLPILNPLKNSKIIQGKDEDDNE